MDIYELWLLVTCVLLIATAAGALAWRAISRRDWVRRVQRLEHARHDWSARVVADQQFWRNK